MERPGLERLRDLAAEGQIQVVLAYSPDRLSRKYAYQILLIEEFAPYGVETLFVKSPQGNSPEDQLLVQFQGMIAEYERAQILERSRRGKRHRAHTGEVSVMSGAPYGYRYIRKTEEALAAYMIQLPEASHLPSGLNARLVTALLWPVRVCTSRPVWRSQSLMLLSALAEANQRPLEGLKLQCAQRSMKSVGPSGAEGKRYSAVGLSRAKTRE